MGVAETQRTVPALIQRAAMRLRRLSGTEFDRELRRFVLQLAPTVTPATDAEARTRVLAVITPWLRRRVWQHLKQYPVLDRGEVESTWFGEAWAACERFEWARADEFPQLLKSRLAHVHALVTRRQAPVNRRVWAVYVEFNRRRARIEARTGSPITAVDRDRIAEEAWRTVYPTAAVTAPSWVASGAPEHPFPEGWDSAEDDVPDSPTELTELVAQVLGADEQLERWAERAQQGLAAVQLQIGFTAELERVLADVQAELEVRRQTRSAIEAVMRSDSDRVPMAVRRRLVLLLSVALAPS